MQAPLSGSQSSSVHALRSSQFFALVAMQAPAPLQAATEQASKSEQAVPLAKLLTTHSLALARLQLLKVQASPGRPTSQGVSIAVHDPLPSHWPSQGVPAVRSRHAAPAGAANAKQLEPWQ